jgi:hypothetical protein
MLLFSKALVIPGSPILTSGKRTCVIRKLLFYFYWNFILLHNYLEISLNCASRTLIKILSSYWFEHFEQINLFLDIGLFN